MALIQIIRYGLQSLINNMELNHIHSVLQAGGIGFRPEYIRPLFVHDRAGTYLLENGAVMYLLHMLQDPEVKAGIEQQIAFQNYLHSSGIQAVPEVQHGPWVFEDSVCHLSLIGAPEKMASSYLLSDYNLPKLTHCAEFARLLAKLHVAGMEFAAARSQKTAVYGRPFGFIHGDPNPLHVLYDEKLHHAVLLYGFSLSRYGGLYEDMARALATWCCHFEVASPAKHFSLNTALLETWLRSYHAVRPIRAREFSLLANQLQQNAKETYLNEKIRQKFSKEVLLQRRNMMEYAAKKLLPALMKELA